MTANELSLSERIVVAHFENGEAAPESFRWIDTPGSDQQHRGEDCPCEPINRGNGVWDHR